MCKNYKTNWYHFKCETYLCKMNLNCEIHGSTIHGGAVSETNYPNFQDLFSTTRHVGGKLNE